MLSMSVLKGITVLFLIQMSFPIAELSSQRQGCVKIGKFDTHTTDFVLAGHVIYSSQVSSRIDCSFQCLNYEPCVSYNYEEGNNVLHECELNNKIKGNKPHNFTTKAGYTYYERSVPAVCLSSPCLNDGTCIESCEIGKGYRCVCISGRVGENCQNWARTAQDYEVLFSKESTADYIESEIAEHLQQFTLCFWISFIQASGWRTFFSHMTPVGQRDLKLSCKGTMDRCDLTLINNNNKLFYMPPINDDLWHHMCVSWENAQGRWDVLVDGALIAYGSAWRSSRSVSPGRLVVGQIQKNYGGGFLLSESFTGKIASFNMWNTKMTNNDLKEKSWSCNQELGNVIDWRMFRQGMHGDAKILSPQSCFSHVKESEYVLDFPVRDVGSFIDTDTLPFVTKFTLSLWIKRSFDASSSQTTIFSYVTTAQDTMALSLYYGTAGSINLQVMKVSEDNYIYSCPPIVDDLWHHVCITWTSIDGKVQFFLDGVLKRATVGYKVNVGITAGGNVRIGQIQKKLGGNNRPSYSYRGKLAKLNMWSTVLNELAIATLFRSPGAENGDLISWKNMRNATIYGGVTVENASIQFTESDFDLNFPTKSTANYAKYTSMPSLTEFTACAWVKMIGSVTGEPYVFTYSTSSNFAALTMGYTPESKTLHTKVADGAWQAYTLPNNLHDNGWHHVCITWKNSNGRKCWLYNGVQLNCFTGYATGQTVEGNGKFILGQEQDSYGGSFQTYQSFYGRMSRVNVWSSVITNNMIERMSKGCGSWNGDAVAWHNFKSSFYGSIQVVSPSSCSLALPTLQAKRDEYCQNRYSSNPSSGCGTTLRALFDKKFNQVGKIWRCFYDVALTRDSYTNLYVYDTVKNLGCLHSIEADLVAITE